MADGTITIDTKVDESGMKGGLAMLGNLAKTSLKGLAVATGAVTGAFVSIVKSSVQARGEMEQLEGGVETIFKGGAEQIKSFANEAYKARNFRSKLYGTSDFLWC